MQPSPWFSVNVCPPIVRVPLRAGPVVAAARIERLRYRSRCCRMKSSATARYSWRSSAPGA